MNQRISRRLKTLVTTSMPGLNEAQQRNAYRGLKRRWSRVPSNARFATITGLERAAALSAAASTEAGRTAEIGIDSSDSLLTESGS